MADKKIEDVIKPVVAEPVPTQESTVTDSKHATVPVQVFSKDSAYFVTLPDGSVVSTRGEYVFTKPGTYVVDGTEVVVTEPAQPKNEESK